MNIYNLQVWLKSNFFSPVYLYPCQGAEHTSQFHYEPNPNCTRNLTTPNKRKSLSLHFYSLFPTLIVLLPI